MVVEYENIKRIKSRMIVSGDHIELYEYDKPIWIGYPRFDPLRKYNNHVVVSKPVDEVRADNLKVTKRKVERFVNANPQCQKFLRLSYADNLDYTNIKLARKHLKDFVLRLERYFLIDLMYLEVIEFQSRGAIHFHLVCNLPYIAKSDLPILDKLWGHGSTNIKRVTTSHVGKYLTKYMTKEMFDGRLFRQKKFTRSNNLNMPDVLENNEIDEYLSELCKNGSVLRVEYSSDIHTKWLGTIHYEKIHRSDRLHPPTG